MSSQVEEANEQNDQERQLQQQRDSFPIGMGFLSSSGIGLAASGIFKRVGAIFSYGVIGAFGFYQLLSYYGYAKVNWSELFSKVKEDIKNSEVAEMAMKSVAEGRSSLKFTIEKLLGFLLGGIIGLFIF